MKTTSFDIMYEAKRDLSQDIKQSVSYETSEWTVHQLKNEAKLLGDGGNKNLSSKKRKCLNKLKIDHIDS